MEPDTLADWIATPVEIFDGRKEKGMPWKPNNVHHPVNVIHVLTDAIFPATVTASASNHRRQ